MTVDITGLCRDHTFETAEDVCRRCGAEYCELCLVFPFGDAKPLCKECAMAAGGVRSHVSRPAMGRKDLRRALKAFDARRKAAAAAATDAEESPVLTDPLAPTNEDLERATAPIHDPVPEPVTAFDEPVDGDAFVDELAAAFTAPAPAPAPAPTPPPAPSPTPMREQPADGVAPPIDWNRPFG